MRPRDFERVAAAPCDVLIVGGGMYGLSIARAAAASGLRTTLIDAADFGSGSSFGQKLLHGGLPALKRGQLGRARRAIRERRDVARSAPWLLRPVPVIVGTYRSVVKSRMALRAAFKIDGWIGRDRNLGVEPELHLPAARLVSRAATVRLFPGLHQDGLTGGAQWYDYQLVENERLIVALAAAAEQAGAELVNHVEGVSALRENGRVAGMKVRDVLTGAESEIRAPVVVNVAGGKASGLLAAFGVSRSWPLLRALSVVTTKRATDIALAAPSADGRVLTADPLAEPGHRRAEPDACAARRQFRSGNGVRRAARSYDEANRAFPSLNLKREEITLVQSGILPATADRAGRLTPPLHAADHQSRSRWCRWRCHCSRSRIYVRSTNGASGRGAHREEARATFAFGPRWNGRPARGGHCRPRSACHRDGAQRWPRIAAATHSASDGTLRRTCGGHRAPDGRRTCAAASAP